MFILEIVSKDGVPERRCSIEMFDTNEDLNTFYFKQRLDDDWVLIRFKSYVIYDNDRPYPVIEVRRKDDGNV